MHFSLIASLKCAIGILIGLGALVGKVDLLQMLIYSIIFIILYSLN